MYLTLMIKKLVASRSEADEDGISLVGTLIQRPLLYDLASLPRCSGQNSDALLRDESERGRDVRRGVF